MVPREFKSKKLFMFLEKIAKKRDIFGGFVLKSFDFEIEHTFQLLDGKRDPINIVQHIYQQQILGEWQM